MAHTPKERAHAGDYDVAIVGAGPAGMSAAIWLGRFLHDTILVDAGDPRNWAARQIHGYLGVPHTSPHELRRRGALACGEYGVTSLSARVTDVIHRGEDRFDLRTDGGDAVTARRLLLATGIRDNWPDIPGLQRSFGVSIHTCPNCDGYESRLSTVSVIGASSRAVSVARAMKTWTDNLTIVTHGQPPDFSDAESRALKRMNITVNEALITGIIEDHRHLQALKFADGTTERCEHLFLATGQHPRDRVADQLGCDTNEFGFVIVDAHHHTSVWNVFAAGDITPGAQMAIRAAAGGAEAALSIHHSLIPADRRVHRRC